MKKENEGYYEVFSLERSNGWERLEKRATSAKETSARLRPDLVRDVIRPTWWAAVFGWGFVFALSMIFIGMYGSYEEPRVWITAAGFTLLLGSWNGIYVLRQQLPHFRDLQMVTRTLEIQVADSGRARIMTRDPDNPRRSTISRYQWATGKLREFAASNVNQYGEWRGPDKLIRAHLKDYVTNYTERFPDVVSDFQADGWIDADNRWTAKGKAEMARKAVS